MGNNKEHKVNIKARIDRHSRALKENLTLKNKVFNILKKNNLGFRIVVCIMVFITPIYPIFAGIIHNNNEYDFYRGYIDEDSILYSFDSNEIPIIENAITDELKGDFISDSTLLNENRNYDGTKEIREYIIKPGDSFSLIASKFKVSINTIYEYNNLDKNYILKPGSILKIPATSGIPYIVKSGDSLISIAEKYKIDKQKILTYNPDLEKRSLKKGEEIFLPGAKKIVKKPKTVVPKKTYNKTTYTKKDNNFTNNYTSSKGVYKLVRRKPFSGAWGNCTYYVASYKNVDWRGNANQWLENAAKKGHTVVYGRGFKPKLGAIVVLEGRGYNLRYGHVAIVMEVKDKTMIVSDMNYRKINEVTYREISLNSNNITGYIYVD